MRLKRDSMGNGHLLPAYNVQAAICDEYIAVVDVKPYTSNQNCLVPLMEKFKELYGHYPKYPVADADYGSYNHYLYCEEHGMKKYIKFTMLSFYKPVLRQAFVGMPKNAENKLKYKSCHIVTNLGYHGCSF